MECWSIHTCNIIDGNDKIKVFFLCFKLLSEKKCYLIPIIKIFFCRNISYKKLSDHVKSKTVTNKFSENKKAKINLK